MMMNALKKRSGDHRSGIFSYFNKKKKEPGHVLDPGSCLVNFLIPAFRGLKYRSAEAGFRALKF